MNGATFFTLSSQAQLNNFIHFPCKCYFNGICGNCRNNLQTRSFGCRHMILWHLD